MGLESLVPKAEEKLGNSLGISVSDDVLSQVMEIVHRTGMPKTTVGRHLLEAGLEVYTEKLGRGAIRRAARVTMEQESEKEPNGGARACGCRIVHREKFLSIIARHGWKISDVAKLVGYSSSGINSYLRPKASKRARVSPTLADKFSKQLQVPVTDFLIPYTYPHNRHMFMGRSFKPMDEEESGSEAEQESE